MRVNARSRYAVTAMVDLAVHASTRSVSLVEIAERHAMPLPYLEQLFAQLRRAGLVTSARGFQGGFSLSRPAEKISLLDIVTATDSPIKTTGCSGESSTCNGANKKCVTHDLWLRLGNHIHAFFSETTLASVASQAVSAMGMSTPVMELDVNVSEIAS